MKKATLMVTILMLVSGYCMAQGSGASGENNLDRKSDSHFHLLDFLQNGEFLNTDHRFPGTEWGLTASEGQLCMLSAAPTVRLQVRIGDPRLKDTEPHGFSEPAPCPLKGHIG